MELDIRSESQLPVRRRTFSEATVAFTTTAVALTSRGSASRRYLRVADTLRVTVAGPVGPRRADRAVAATSHPPPPPWCGRPCQPCHGLLNPRFDLVNHATAAASFAPTRSADGAAPTRSAAAATAAAARPVEARGAKAAPRVARRRAGPAPAAAGGGFPRCHGANPGAPAPAGGR